MKELLLQREQFSDFSKLAGNLKNICDCQIFPLNKYFDEILSYTFETHKKHKINELVDRSQKREPKHTKEMTKCCLCICFQPLFIQVDRGPYCLYESLNPEACSKTDS